MPTFPAAVASEISKQDLPGSFVLIADEPQANQEQPHRELLVLGTALLGGHPFLVPSHLEQRFGEAGICLTLAINIMEREPREPH